MVNRSGGPEDRGKKPEKPRINPRFRIHFYDENGHRSSEVAFTQLQVNDRVKDLKARGKYIGVETLR